MIAKSTPLFALLSLLFLLPRLVEMQAARVDGVFYGAHNHWRCYSGSWVILGMIPAIICSTKLARVALRLRLTLEQHNVTINVKVLRRTPNMTLDLPLLATGQLSSKHRGRLSQSL